MVRAAVVAAARGLPAGSSDNEACCAGLVLHVLSATLAFLLVRAVAQFLQGIYLCLEPRAGRFHCKALSTQLHMVSQSRRGGHGDDEEDYSHEVKHKRTHIIYYLS